MTEIERMEKRHNEVVLLCRDELAMQLDPEAFKPPSMTVTLLASTREKARRQVNARDTANGIIRNILVVLDQEYAVYYTGKGKIAQA